MKNRFLYVMALSLALIVAGAPASRADSVLQNGTPGAQGTQGTNPTHQDQNVTGPNGEHSTNTNPANEPPPAHKKKHHKKSSTSATTSTNSSSM